MDAVAPHRRPALRVDGSRYRVDAARSGQQRHGERRDRQPERRRDARSVEGHRVLRQRRHRLPQQQRARHDDHARRRRQSGRSGDAAGARQGRRSRRAHGRHSASADARYRCGRSGSGPSSSTTATSARPSPARRASATASRSPTTTAPRSGWCSTATCRCRGRDSREFDPAGQLRAGGGRHGRLGGRQRRRTSTARSAACAGATSGRARWSRTTRCGRRRRAWSTCRAAISSSKNLRVDRGRLQPLRRAGQRHRLLLHVAPAGRAAAAASRTSTSIRRCRALFASALSSRFDRFQGSKVLRLPDAVRASACEARSCSGECPALAGPSEDRTVEGVQCAARCARCSSSCSRGRRSPGRRPRVRDRRTVLICRASGTFPRSRRSSGRRSSRARSS